MGWRCGWRGAVGALCADARCLEGRRCRERPALSVAHENVSRDYPLVTMAEVLWNAEGVWLLGPAMWREPLPIPLRSAENEVNYWREGF